MFTRSISIALVVLSLTVLRATATIVIPPNIDSLVATSNLVILGELLVVERGAYRTVEANGMRIQVRADQYVVRIDDVINGAAGSAVRFEVLASQDNTDTWKVPPIQIYGLFFLRRDDKGKFSLPDTDNGYIAVPRGVHGLGTTPQDRVMSILAQMLSFPNNQYANHQALSYLTTSKSKAANSILRDALAKVGDPELRIRIANALVLQGDATSLKYLKQVFLTEPGIFVSSEQEKIFGDVIGLYIKDPEAISDLTALLNARSVLIRRGVVQALRRTNSPKAIKGLIKAAKDSDPQVRYLGVAGLAEVTGKSN